jgi:hypothetical protein
LAVLGRLDARRPDLEEELREIWEAWFERMTDGNHFVYLTPTQLAGLKKLSTMPTPS